MPVPVVLRHAVRGRGTACFRIGGGETEFADMRAAYDALDDQIKTEIGRSDHRARYFFLVAPARSL